MNSVPWFDLLVATVQRRALFRLILSRPLGSGTMQKVTVRPVQLQGELHFQWTARIGQQERHENLTTDEMLRRISQQFGTAWGDLHWFADDGDFTVRNKPKGQVVFKRKPPTQSPPPSDHNQSRRYIIPDGKPCSFLIAAGIMTSEGKVKPTAYHKFRQINRYLEFIADILPHLPTEGPLTVVDFGCGKSYLTFALHHFLTKTHHREVDIVGLDRKADVIAGCSETARKLDCRGLQFREGDIATFTPVGPVHLAVSLHACDTATDDALAAALRWQCDVILAVPCCQHELCQGWSGRLPGITAYGLFKDRFAAIATDALRARFLDCHGYRTQIVEFIETEHTPKNVLIRAVKRLGHDADHSGEQAAYDSLKRELGVATFHLERSYSDLLPLQTRVL